MAQKKMKQAKKKDDSMPVLKWMAFGGTALLVVAAIIDAITTAIAIAGAGLVATALLLRKRAKDKKEGKNEGGSIWAQMFS